MFVPTLLVSVACSILFAGAGVALLALRSHVEYGEVICLFVLATFWMLMTRIQVYIGSDITVDTRSIGRAVFSWTIMRASWQSITGIKVFQMPSRRNNLRPLVFTIAYLKNGRTRKFAFGNRISNYVELRDELIKRVSEYSIPVEGDCRGELDSNTDS